VVSGEEKRDIKCHEDSGYFYDDEKKVCKN
jgi:hypothetical protein